MIRMKLHRSYLAGLAFFVLGCSSDNSNRERDDTTNNYSIYCVYEGEFSESERDQLSDWVHLVQYHATSVLGDYPFDVTYYFQRENGSDRAVVFGHTARKDSVHGVHLYVDPTFPESDFLEDWIAPHEISHLAIPVLDRKDRWFIEGFATYMSREVMLDMGIYTREQVDSINLSRIIEMKPFFISTSPLRHVCDSLIQNHRNYPAVYWIGASYFHQANRLLLNETGLPLTDVLKEFQTCCHKNRMQIEEVISEFDAISETRIFSDLFEDYISGPVNTLLLDYDAEVQLD